MPVLTDEAIEVITAKFKEADTDDTGFVTAAQLTAILTPFCAREELEPPNEERITARINSLATEKKGELNLVEVLFAIGYLKVMMVCELLFSEADKDESGALNPEEIKNVITKVCERDAVDPPSDAVMDDFIAEIGGEVTFDMFASVAVPRILLAAGIEIIDDVAE
mmetsp:Transcript_50169/g.56037  ORF Transcript_50169/g.56037 Transcript_50169/m.56037 type:complete len:166 (+) Transcript_50169:228-725(+)